MRDHLLTERIAAAENPEGFEVLDMSIDEAGMNLLMSNLTNLYAHPELAVLREYMANALDSHERAKQPKPVRVHLPLMDFYGRGDLVIEDFGTGMSKAEIQAVYSRYGASTKRESNNQIGKFGLGAKSALAITNRFDIVATKDGITTTAYVQKGSAGTGQFFFVSEERTDAPNGVRVTVPVTKVAEYSRENLDWFFCGIHPSKLEVEGAFSPSILVHDPKKFEPLIFSNTVVGWVALGEYSSTNLTRLHVNVAGIHYEVDADGLARILTPPQHAEAHESLKLLRKYGRTVVLNVPLGGVRLTPPREDFIYDLLTTETFANLITYSVAALQRRAQSALNKHPSFKEALAYYVNLVDLRTPNAGQLRYRGEPVPLEFDAGGWSHIIKNGKGVKDTVETFAPGQSFLVTAVGRAEGSTYWIDGSLRFSRALPFAERKAILITNASQQDVIFAQRQLMKTYEQLRFQNGLVDANVWFLTPGVKPSHWVEPLITEMLTFDEFKALVRVEQARRRTSAKAAGILPVTKDPVKFALFHEELPKRFADSVATPYRVEMLTPGEIAALGKPVVISHKGMASAFSVGSFASGKKAPQSLYDYKNVVAFLRHFRPDALLVGVPKAVSADSLEKRFPNHERLDAILLEQVARAATVHGREYAAIAAAKNARESIIYRLAVVASYAKRLSPAQLERIESQATRKWLRELCVEEKPKSAELSLDEQLVAKLGQRDANEHEDVQALLKKWRARASQYILLPATLSHRVVNNEALDHFVLYLNAVDKSGEQ